MERWSIITEYGVREVRESDNIGGITKVHSNKGKKGIHGKG
jgi:hypothetical protein